MYDKYVVLDLETTMHSPISSEAHPMWPMNTIVMFGMLDHDAVTTMSGKMDEGDDRDVGLTFENYVHEGVPIIGHNLKFDLSYLLKYGYFSRTELVQHRIWDTQVVEYLLSAQTHTYPSLDELAVKYGGTVKDESVKKMWEDGVPTELIPEKVLSDYLLGDLKNTELVYKAQRKKVRKYGMEKLVESQMQALVAVTIMECSGMKVDSVYIDKRCEELGAEIEALEKTLRSSVTLPDNYGEWSWSSPRDVSNILFGGTYKVKEKKLVGKYKNGKDKFKTEDVVYSMEGAGASPSSCGATMTKLGWWTTDDAVLKNVGGTFSKAVLELRKLSKQKETYYENMKSLMFPNGFIYPNINMVSTKTGRLSCNKPNIQNQTTEGGIKDAYISRYGDDGVIAEFDFSQLEMAGLAFVSGDEQLTEDINNNIDMHSELYKGMYGRYPTKDERKPFKRLSFGLVYGAGAKKLAEQAGCSVDDAKRFIDVFYARYSGVKRFHEQILEEATRKRILIAEHTPKGMPRHAFLKKTATGRMYVFKEYDNEWKKEPSFSPTELKNWLVQGFSTGDVVPHMLGHVVKQIYTHNIPCVPIMTVHDSVLFDVKKEVVNVVTTIVSAMLNKTSEVVNEFFGTKLEVKLSTGCSVGPNWGNLKEI